MSTYILSSSAPTECSRLRALEAIYDPGTVSLLDRIGVSDGWRCLEVGAGAGSVAAWMASRVGAHGRVVATDIDTRFIEQLSWPNVEVRQHDITTGSLEDEGFDLVHTRAVLEHLPEPAHAVERLMAALRPGGWLLVEVFDLSAPMLAACARHTNPPRAAGVVQACLNGAVQLMALAGADPVLAPVLTDVLHSRGLRQVHAEMRSALVRGDPQGLHALSFQQVRDRALEAGILCAELVDQGAAVFSGPASRLMVPVMVAAWGQR